MGDLATKREREKQVVSQMIALYCRKKHGGKKQLCPACAALDRYARQRSDRCPFMETKTFCSNCRVHCYRPDMREQIRQVMRFSGPRDVVLPSGDGNPPCHRNPTGETKIGGTT